MPPSDTIQSITLNGRSIAYRIKRSARARVCRVHVGAEGVRVVLPTRAPLKAATELLTDQAAWVLRHIDAAAVRLQTRIDQAGLEPGQLLLRGVPVSVTVQTNVSARPIVSASDTGLTIRVGPDPAAAGPALETWLRHEARRDLVYSVHQHRHLVQKQPTRIAVRDQRTRWGSCSTTGTLSFSWRLILAPPPVLEYVVIHELIHLDVPNHSPAFWARVYAACPETDTHKRWLREHQAVVMQPIAP